MPLREFLAAYHSHLAGLDHDLIVVFNGVTEQDHPALLAELQHVEHRLIELPRPAQDLAAYAAAAEQLEHERLCFLNSYSVILADGWLRILALALQAENVGIAGATGSWESQSEWLRGAPKHWLQQLLGLHQSRRDYPRFPNPHIRTTAFAIERRLLLELGLSQVCDKRAAYLLESGWRSITRSIHGWGLRTVVVGRDGRVYDVEHWARSHTFRSGFQENLLVADNRTADWLRAPSRLRRRLSKDAWGDGELTSSPLVAVAGPAASNG